MCGIAGVLHFNSQQARPVIIKRMTDSMENRGPNSDDFFAQNQIAICRQRLSNINLSASDNLPILDASGNFQMVFNGGQFKSLTLRNNATFLALMTKDVRNIKPTQSPKVLQSGASNVYVSRVYVGTASKAIRVIND